MKERPCIRCWCGPGGSPPMPFPYGTVYLREELKKREKDQLELLANRLQSDLAALSLEAVAGAAFSGSGGGGASASTGLAIGQQLLAQLRSTKPVGRLVIDVEGVYKGRAGGPDDVVVKDGDRLVVPKITQEITILGEVQSPTSHVFQAGLTRDDYIAKSGGAHPESGSQAYLCGARQWRCGLGCPLRLVQALAERGNTPRGHDRRAARYGTGPPAAAVAGHHHDHLQPCHRIRYWCVTQGHFEG